MSQRCIHYGPYEALTGWDRPLQYWFLVIEDLTDTESESEYVFSNLSRTNPAMSLNDIRLELEKVGIPIPPTLFTDLIRDRQTNAGNMIYHYHHTAGKWVITSSR